MQVEDHPLEYINFEGIIPLGYYGAGPVVIWDSGTYIPLEQTEDNINFSLYGKKLKGDFVLIHMRQKGHQWLLIKQKDKYASSEWKLEISLTPEKKARLKERIPPCGIS